MIQTKCIQKFRDKQGKIYGYRLADVNGQTQDVTSDNLKLAIKTNQITVVNLKLTSDNRLVDTETKLLKNEVLGAPPVANKSKEDKLEEQLTAMLDKPQKEFISIVGNGDAFCGVDFYIDKGKVTYITQILGVYYDAEGEMYGCTLGIDYSKDKKEAYIMFQDDGAMGSEIISSSTQLSSPLASKENSERIAKMINKFAYKVKDWTIKADN